MVTDNIKNDQRGEEYNLKNSEKIIANYNSTLILPSYIQEHFKAWCDQLMHSPVTSFAQHNVNVRQVGHLAQASLHRVHHVLFCYQRQKFRTLRQRMARGKPRSKSLLYHIKEHSLYQKENEKLQKGFGCEIKWF